MCPFLGEGSVSPSRRSRNQGGSPKRRGNKNEAETASPNNGKSTDPKLGPIRKTAGVRNLPKIERKNGIGSSGLDDLVGPPPLMPTSSLVPRKSTGGGNVMNDLDPVEESPTESQED